MTEIELLNIETSKLENVMFFEYLSIKLDELLRSRDENVILLSNLLSIVNRIKLQPTDKKQPYLVQELQHSSTEFSYSSKLVNSTITISDYLEQYLVMSDSDIEKIDSPFIKARLYDLRWVKDKSIIHATKALDNYIAIPITLENWVYDSEPMLIRAMVLAKQVKKEAVVEKLFNDIYQMVIQLDPPLYRENLYPITLMVRYLLSFNLIDNSNYRALVDKLVNVASVSKLYPLPAYILCVEVCRKCNAFNEATNILFNGIQKIVEEPLNHFELMELKDTLEQKIPQTERSQIQFDELLSEIKQKIALSGKSVVNNMDTQESQEIDISSIIQRNLKELDGKHEIEILDFLFHLQSDSEFFELIEKEAQTDLNTPSIAEILFSQTIFYAADGRIIQKSPPRPENLSDIKAVENYLAFKKSLYFNKFFELHFKRGALPILQNFLRNIDSNARETLINELVDKSSFVPHNRIKIVTLALNYGFESKFTEAMHILVPQFEHMVRELLKKKGVNTITTDADGTQNEIGLSSLMDRSEIQQIFDIQTIFEIKELFTANTGFNLRNNIAHGLLGDNSINRLDLVYGWLLILRLIRMG
jgi:hypothetical protein